MFEELLSEDENTKPTHHPKIMIAENRETDHDYILTRIDSLLEDLYSYSEDEMVQELRELVPEYQTSNGRYSKPQKVQDLFPTEQEHSA